MTEPLLSVTVTNYNYARFLDQTIESIRSQSFTDFEVILIDNASTDESVDVMRRHASSDPRIRVVVHEQNEGMFASLRQSCELCRGRYRVQIDADDWVLDTHAFQRQVDMLERHPTMSFVYSAMAMVESDGSEVHTSHPYPGDVVLTGEAALEGVLSFNLTHSGMMLRLDSYRKSAGYPDGFPHVADMSLAARLCETGDVGYLDRRLYAFRQHESNLHLRPQLQVIRHEILPVIDEAFGGPLGSRISDAAATRRRVERNALVHLPTQYVFGGQRRVGWRLYWESLRVRPIDTLLQRRTLSLAARTVLGARGYERLATRVGVGATVPMPSG